ncbi:Methionine Synthase Reductase [Manis pentadactyla]|nr:Methionine Synthase Reductase [Manis pentadactyla]
MKTVTDGPTDWTALLAALRTAGLGARGASPGRRHGRGGGAPAQPRLSSGGLRPRRDCSQSDVAFCFMSYLKLLCTSKSERQSGDAGHASALVMPITLLLLESHRCLRLPPSSLRLHIKRNVGKQEAKLVVTKGPTSG